SSRDMQQLYQDLKHRTESERVEQEAIMRATLESAIEGIMIVDNKRQVIAMNKRFAEMAQLPESELAQRDQRVLAALAVKSVKTAESVLSRIDGMQETDGTWRDELELINGSVIDYFSAPVRTPDGTQVARVGFFRDITAERHAHQQLEQARE